MRKIASNKLLTCEGLLEHPLLEVDDVGHILSIRTSSDPDREPFTEFYAGLLIGGLDAELIERTKKDNASLLDTLPSLLHPNEGLYLVTGIDYRTLRPTPAMQILRLA